MVFEVGLKSQMPAALFAGVVASLADSSKSILRTLAGGSGTKLTVDPRPLRTRPISGAENAMNNLILAASPVLDSLPPSELARRLRTLQDAGFARGDASAFQQCPGSGMVAMPGKTLPPHPWKACPPSGTVVAVLGAESVSDTVARVEVLILMADPGTSALTNTFTMRATHGRWRLTEQEPWVIVE